MLFASIAVFVLVAASNLLLGFLLGFLMFCLWVGVGIPLLMESSNRARDEQRKKMFEEYQSEKNFERKSALGKEIVNIIDSRSDDDWRVKDCAHYLQWRRQIVAEIATGQPNVESPSVRHLAELRADSLITDDEFKAFCDQFSRTSGEKSQEIVKAIEGLHKQFRLGAMSEGNYHSGLWALLDKMDRRT